jgi:inhibitor of KinA
MNSPVVPYQIFPVGDSAITIDFGNCIDEKINREVITRFHQLQAQPIPGMIEAVPAYSSLTIHYDVLALKKKTAAGQTAAQWMAQELQVRLQEPIEQWESAERLVRIPVCYEKEWAPDISLLAATSKLSIADIIQLHTAKNYKVYMLGFLPGFPYLGEVDERIAIPRKQQPVNVVAGSVGIAGRQNGIYPMASPGGWQIIGTTPLQLFKATPNHPPVSDEVSASENPELSITEPTLLKAGDSVQFYSITKEEFDEIKRMEAWKS